MAFVYPFKKYNYIVTISELGQAGFSEVSAPEVSQDPIEYREGNFSSNTAGKQQGLVKYGNVTLKWGTTSSKKAFDWMVQADTGTLKRCDVKITLNGDDQKPVAEWNLINALPVKYIAPDFNATGNEIAVESLELACEGIIRTK